MPPADDDAALDEIAVELYALTPEEFTAARNARAAASARALAARVKALRKPTVAAWAVDRLAREGQLADALDLAAALRDAQDDLDAAELSRLGRQRRGLVAEAPLLHGAGLVVLDQDVGVLEQAQEHALALGPAQIETERALVAVDADEVGSVLAGIEGRAPVAHLVALRRLDLDDLGAVVAQDLGGVWPAQHPGDVRSR